MKSPKETKVSGMGTYGVSGELRVKGIICNFKNPLVSREQL